MQPHATPCSSVQHRATLSRYGRLSLLQKVQVSFLVYKVSFEDRVFRIGWIGVVRDVVKSGERDHGNKKHELLRP
jgi:hypothetical protein